VRAKEKGMRYIAMNNFQIAADQAEPFEERWRRRQSYLQGAPGFESFQLLRGESHNGTIHYVSHSTWASKEAFLAWTESESFVQAHRGEPSPKGWCLAHPILNVSKS
jgi:heme-degrading monooxygenase HmoA